MPKELPFIDAHETKVDADPEAVWRSLIATLSRSRGTGIFAIYAGLIGAEPRVKAGPPGQIGSTIVGFQISRAIEPALLELSGRHRFSVYSLTWEIEETGQGRSKVRGTTRARFPGIHGRIYKAMVIDSGAHARIAKKMLATVARVP